MTLHVQLYMPESHETRSVLHVLARVLYTGTLHGYTGCNHYVTPSTYAIREHAPLAPPWCLSKHSLCADVNDGTILHASYGTLPYGTLPYGTLVLGMREFWVCAPSSSIHWSTT